jgi:hypothetical protein
MMVTTEEMRLFARDYLRWAEQTSNPNDRETLVRVARMWMNTTSGIERRINGGSAAGLGLRTKLD